VRWSTQLPSGYAELRGAAAGADSTLYAGGYGGTWALSGAGSIGWSRTDIQANFTPTVTSGGTLLVTGTDGSGYGVLSALSLAGTRRWTMGDMTAGYMCAVTVGPDGTVFVVSGDGFVFAIEGASGPAASSWPAYQHDCRHTGRAR
jgi:outer membrane protein assembly factor BamB